MNLRNVFKSRNNLLIIIMIGILSISLLVSACTVTKNNQGDKSTENNINAETNGNTKLEGFSGNLEIIGSTSTQVLVETFTDEFMSKNTDAKINYQGVGSSKGIKAVNDGTANIGTSSRELKEEEKGWGLTEYVMAKDGIAIVIHPNNKIGNLSRDQVVKIFTGEIINWKEVGGDDANIIVSSREAGSGTRGAFEEILKIEDKVRKDALIYDGNGPVKAAIASSKNAIGYISFGYIDETVKAVKVDDIEPNLDSMLSGSYTLQRPFIMVTKGNAEGLTKSFIDYVLSDEGQLIVKEQGFIPVK